MMKIGVSKPKKMSFDVADKFDRGDIKLTYLQEKLTEHVFNPAMALQLLNFA
jgi:hypothetical protein